MTPEPVKKFVEQFSKLPSIGPRQATRLAFYLVNDGKTSIIELAKAMAGLSQLKHCAECFNVMNDVESALCSICGNPTRRHDVVAIIEKETDLLSLEKTKKFNGRYLIIGELEKGGMLTSMQKLRLASLKNRIKKSHEDTGGKIHEIVLAINPTTFGDMSAETLREELAAFATKISRLGRGLPRGGEIEFADEDTLSGAIDNRV